MIQQGDIYWLDLGIPYGSEPGYLHPHVVVQNDRFNDSGIRTVLVCGITSNLRLAQAPGNVLLEPNEAGLAKPSVVNVSQMVTVDKGRLVEKTGTLSRARMREVIAGIHLVIEP